MRVSMIVFGGLALAAAAPAFAEDTAPPPPVTINATATMVTDYRFRGVSQTDKNFAVQGGVSLTHESGVYVSFWGSSVHSYVTSHAEAHQEIDLVGGWKKTFSGTTFDVGALYYFYPHSTTPGDVTSSDFIEPYVDIAHTWGPFTGKVTVNYAPKQKALALDQTGKTTPKHDNTYLAGDFSLAVPKTPLSFTAHLGHSWGPSWLATDSNGKKGYTDWNLGAAYTWKQLTLGVSYVDTDAHFLHTLAPGVVKDNSKGTVVGSLGVAF